MILKVDKEISLRQLEESDSEALFQIIDSQRTYMGKWLPFVALSKELKDTAGFVTAIVNAPEESTEYIFIIRKNEVCVGLIGFKASDKKNHKTEIGYWLSEDYQKQGIVTKSVKLMCEFAFNELGINRIQIKCAVDNLPSKNIPKRLGFKFEGIERDGELLTGNIYTDLDIYSLLKSEF